ncbi:unnamed protein product [Rotaria sordida]|uniref:Uncharacterized protein n=1 Tax=Rotaria sordida TaxID=392033 RepID=A0A819F1H8_9BILA|nr:unnamed protein product [Rotaria sordida]CAF3858866.1 unnamed protein product [Rotaria sordida]
MYVFISNNTHGTNSSLFRDDSLNGGVTNPDGVELKFIIFIQHRLRTSKIGRVLKNLLNESIFYFFTTQHHTTTPTYTTSCSEDGTSILLCIVILTASCIEAGPVAYGICQAGCAAVVVACYAAAGAVFGTVTAGAATAPAILACNVAFGKCSVACAAIALTPTP